MAKLNLKLEEKEQVGADTRLKLQLSENDGPKGISFELTLHDVREQDVDVKEGGMLVVTKEGAPVYVNFGKPAENMF